LTFGCEKVTKTLGKVGAMAFQTKWHDLFLPDPDRLTGQWVMRALPSTLLRDQKKAYPAD
ncbi:MAG: hypothetical protein WBA14_10045, partial [Pseudolabrys sp.]